MQVTFSTARVLAGRWSASRRAQLPYHLRCTARSALSERLCTHQPGSRGWDGGCFLTFRRRYSLGVELSALQDSQSSRTLNARRWLSCRVPQRRPVALRRADRWPLVLLRYTAIHLRCILHLRCIALYHSVTRVQLNEGTVHNCARTCKLPSQQLGS